MIRVERRWRNNTGKQLSGTESVRKLTRELKNNHKDFVRRPRKKKERNDERKETQKMKKGKIRVTPKIR